MKHILLIPVGGTICTALTDRGTLAVYDGAGLRLKADFLASDSPFADKVEIDTAENLMILSENMTPETWNRILDVCRENMTASACDGVIVAHGTDTLAYSAALFAQIFAHTDIPIFFVSSQAPLSSPRANGTDNFRCAVECIGYGIEPNVYVSYRNPSDGVMYLHLGSRIRQCANYSDDFFSVGAIAFGGLSERDFSAALDEVKRRFPHEKRVPLPAAVRNVRLTARVLKLPPYVGMDYDAYDLSRFDSVLHGTYHSGTACTVSEERSQSLRHFVDRCVEEGVDLYLSPSKAEGEVYDTVRMIAEHRAKGVGARFLYGFTDETVYAKLMLAYSLFGTDEERLAFIEQDGNFERIV